MDIWNTLKCEKIFLNIYISEWYLKCFSILMWNSLKWFTLKKKFLSEKKEKNDFTIYNKKIYFEVRKRGRVRDARAAWSVQLRRITMPLPMRIRAPVLPYSGIFRTAARHFLTATSLTPTTTNLRICLSTSLTAIHHRYDTPLRYRTFALPLFHQQSSTYGRFAFHDVSSDESDLEFAPPHSQSRPQQQLVSTLNSSYSFLYITVTYVVS